MRMFTFLDLPQLHPISRGVSFLEYYLFMLLSLTVVLLHRLLKRSNIEARQAGDKKLRQRHIERVAKVPLYFYMISPLPGSLTAILEYAAEV